MGQRKKVKRKTRFAGIYSRENRVKTCRRLNFRADGDVQPLYEKTLSIGYGYSRNGDGRTGGSAPEPRCEHPLAGNGDRPPARGVSGSSARVLSGPGLPSPSASGVPDATAGVLSSTAAHGLCSPAGVLCPGPKGLFRLWQRRVGWPPWLGPSRLASVTTKHGAAWKVKLRTLHKLAQLAGGLNLHLVHHLAGGWVAERSTPYSR